MNRFFSLSPKFLVAATLATAALGAASVAEARSNVFLSVGLQGVPAFVEPAPVYVRPPIFVAPRPVFERPSFGRYDARREWERERDWRRAEWLRHQRHEQFRGFDRDHDRGHDRDNDHDRGERKHHQ